jgi:sensor histidine kinase YesM
MIGKLKPLLVILLVLGFITAKSQCILLDNHPDLKSSVYCFIDSTGRLPKDQISSQRFHKYSAIKFSRFLLKSYRYNYWFKFCLENDQEFEKEALVSMGEVYLQDYFLKFSTGNRTHFTVSQDKRFAANQYAFDHKYLLVKLPPKSKIEFLTLVKDKPGQVFLLNPVVKTISEEQSERLSLLYQERFAMALNIGLNAILFFVLVFVAVQYYFVRYKYLLFYALYLFCMMLFHLWGFSYSSFFQTPISLIPFLKFDLRQNFYVVLTQIFYMLFLREFFNISENGSKLQKFVFKLQHYVFLAILVLDVFFSLVLQRLDFELVLALITQFFVVSISTYLLFTMFTSKLLKAPVTVRLASLVLFVGVIFGFLSATFEWVKTTSPILQFYPNFFFNFCVIAEVFLYSLAIGQLFFKNITEKGILNQRIALTELNMLRSQINPHFLFNSLNSIKSLVVREKKQEAAIFLTELSALIRNILQKSREQFLSLEEELKFTEDYLKIEKKRFEDAFEYTIELDEKIKNYTVPAFILQPFVENSIKHGFLELKEKGQITIKAFGLENSISIEISDNGIGRERAAKIKFIDQGHQSIGTHLIEDRLKILNEIYGWKIKFQIVDLEKGTKVLLKIPFFE